MTRRIVGILIIIFGLSILLGDLVVKLAIALAFVYLGVRILSGPHGERKAADTNANTAPATNADYLNEVVIFGPLDKIVRSDDFKGGKIVAVFGGGRLIVPKNWKVNSQGTAVVGNYSNRVSGGTGAVTLNVNGSAVMASIEIVS